MPIGTAGVNWWYATSTNATTDANFYYLAASTNSVSTNNVTIRYAWDVQPQPMTEEERRVSELRQEEARRQAALRRVEQESARRELAAEQAAAVQRAEELLLSHLAPEQTEELQRHGYFTVDVFRQDGEHRRYRIRRGRSMNVEQVGPRDGHIATFCAHPTLACPDADTMLAQKLMLETAEDEFLAMANVRR